MRHGKCYCWGSWSCVGWRLLGANNYSFLSRGGWTLVRSRRLDPQLKALGVFGMHEHARTNLGATSKVQVGFDCFLCLLNISPSCLSLFCMSFACLLDYMHMSCLYANWTFLPLRAETTWQSNFTKLNCSLFEASGVVRDFPMDLITYLRTNESLGLSWVEDLLAFPLHCPWHVSVAFFNVVPV